ncbi:MAG: SMI1/KNR4 family protein [Gemmatimonadetes bacterium]|nr:SMI1/KNR4 family protein [Gemmatimonadota bacterium]
MNFDDFALRLGDYKYQSLGSGVDEVAIQRAEKVLEVQLPRSYKEFLRRFGWGGVGHWELYGLGSDVPEYLDLLRMTLSEREEMRPRVPFHLVPIMNDGYGNHYCLDTNKVKGDECPVVFWDHDLPENQDPKFVSNGFVMWLNKLLDDL